MGHVIYKEKSWQCIFADVSNRNGSQKSTQPFLDSSNFPAIHLGLSDCSLQMRVGVCTFKREIQLCP